MNRHTYVSRGLAAKDIAIAEIADSLPNWTFYEDQIFVRFQDFENQEYATKMILKYKDFAIFANLIPDEAKTVFNAQKEHNLDVVKIFPLALDHSFIYPENAPMLFCAFDNTLIYAGLIYRFISLNQWKQVNILCNGNSLYLGIFGSLDEILENKELRIVNHMKISDYTPEEQLPEMLDWQLQIILDSKLRVLYLGLENTMIARYVLNWFYDKGLRSGDLMLLHNGVPQYIQEETDAHLQVFFHLSILFVQPMFVGDIGARFYKNFLAYLHAAPHLAACVTYDSIHHLAQGIRAALIKGEDYTDAVVLQKKLKEIRFTG